MALTWNSSHPVSGWREHSAICLLFFVGHYVAGLTGFEVIAVFILGMLLVLGELVFSRRDASGPAWNGPHGGRVTFRDGGFLPQPAT